MQEMLWLVGHNSWETDESHGKWKMDATDVASITRDNVMMFLNTEWVSADAIAGKIVVEKELSRNLWLQALYRILVQEILEDEVRKRNIVVSHGSMKMDERRYARKVQ